jgi:hypothetical protein
MKINISTLINNNLEAEKADRDSKGRFIQGNKVNEIDRPCTPSRRTRQSLLRKLVLDELTQPDAVTGITMAQDCIRRTADNKPGEVLRFIGSIINKEDRGDSKSSQFAPLIIKADNVHIADSAENSENVPNIESREVIEGTIIDSNANDSKLA